ncbi:hypothetical protein ABZV58_02760 [Nocardia sp. NPDC004654]|uniref:DUF7557 family protein n=1 Tax=Nocardia sp. NPDC004654 TaxID=3154776 RepID=UPI0033B571EC
MNGPTTVKVSSETRDRLAALAAKGETMEEAILKLIDSYEHVKTRQRLAWEARLARAEANPVAVAWAEQTVADLVERAEQRQAGRR